MRVLCETTIDTRLWNAAGGAGAVDLAKSVVAAVNAGPVQFKFLYPPELSIKEKLHTIVTEMYGVSVVITGDDG